MTLSRLKESTASRLVTFLALVAFATGCSTMQPISGSDFVAITAQVDIGDKVKITRSDSSTIKFRVDEISESGIGGDGEFVAFDEIHTIEAGRGELGTGILMATFAVIVVAAVAASASMPTISFAQ